MPFWNYVHMNYYNIVLYFIQYMYMYMCVPVKMQIQNDILRLPNCLSVILSQGLTFKCLQ